MPKHKFNEDVENFISKKIVDEEYQTAKRAMQQENIDFEAIIAMLEGKREEKDYDWMSDINIPEMVSIIHTEMAAWAAQDFATRDFTEVKLEGAGKDDKKKCQAAKRCLNQTLNRTGLYHYHKYMRARMINTLQGQVYSLCWWEKEISPKQLGMKQESRNLDVDIYGNPITDMENQTPATENIQTPEYGEDIKTDQFNYQVIDSRNVVTDSRYCYSIQEKDWVIIRDEPTYEDLKKNEKKNQYFNLHLVKELTKSDRKTDISKETYAKVEPDREGDKPVVKRFDRLLRIGKFWVIVKTRDEDGYPIEVIPGYDNQGELKDKAELIETIIEEVYSGSIRILIRFQPNPFRDSRGRPYKPIVRGWCYIHPTKDIGFSDGKYLKETQIAINDMFNMSMDRVKLATLPTLKGRKYAIEDNTTLYFEPQHVMELNDPTDLEEFQIKDNPQGALNTIAMLQAYDQRAVAVFPGTMGETPQKASTTATAVVGAENKATTRANYKSLTFEYTFLLEFYWMILQMTYQFAEAETATKMMGDLAQFFDPDADYTYVPVSSNIETEQNKYHKIQEIDQIIGRLVKFPNPKTPAVINKLLMMIFDLLGEEFQDIKAILFDESVPVLAKGKGQPGTNIPDIKDMKQTQTSNQQGLPISATEDMTRQNPMVM